VWVGHLLAAAVLKEAQMAGNEGAGMNGELYELRESIHIREYRRQLLDASCHAARRLIAEMGKDISSYLEEDDKSYAAEQKERE
jgi:hypothetical protein